MRRAAFFVLAFLAGNAAGQPSPQRAAKGSLNAAEQSEAVNKVRGYARNYTASLPNYTCTQSTRQMMTRPAALVGGPLGVPLRADVIEEQISFVNGREIRTVTKINDSPPSGASRSEIRTVSRGEFGNLLDTIFSPQTGADIRWNRAATLDGRRVYVFGYRVPQSSGYVLEGSTGRVTVPFEGLVYADRQTGAVVRIEMKCIAIPANSEYRSLQLTLNYKAAKIAGREYLLPFGFSMRYETTGNGAFIAAEYKSCRRFSADSTVKFESDSGEPDVAIARTRRAPIPPPEPAPAAAIAEDKGIAIAEIVDAPKLPEPVSEPAPRIIPVLPQVNIVPQEQPEAEAVAAPAPDTVFRASTQLVQVSVIANDKDGKAVTDLRRDEFQILDNGAPQDIRLFLQDRPNSDAPGPQAPGTFTNRIGSGGASVLLLDKLFVNSGNSEFASNVHARQQALKAFRAIPPGDRIAIYALSCRFEVVREFTTDRDSLLEKLDTFHPSPAPCVDPTAPHDDSRISDPQQADVVSAMEKHREDEFNRIAARRQTELGDSEFKAMADHLAGIPGRKNLIWVTSQFLLSPANLKTLIDANVAIYPVDAEGILVGMESAKQARYAHLLSFAAPSGGVVFFDRDDFAVGIRDALRDGRVSYTLGFYPASEDKNRPVHQLGVRVTRPGVALRYRTSYELKPLPSLSASPVVDLVRALNRPVDATVIPVTANATRSGDRVNLSVSIDVPSLDLALSDGLWKGKAEVVVRFETADGLPAGDVSAQTLTVSFRPDTYESMAKSGDPYRHRAELPIPPNAVELKVLVGSLASGKIGTLTIPLSEIRTVPQN